VSEQFVHVSRLGSSNEPTNARRRGSSPNDITQTSSMIVALHFLPHSLITYVMINAHGQKG
jgi:hypothetical protein